MYVKDTERERGGYYMASKRGKKVAPTKKSEVGKELEAKIKASKTKFSKSQQEILKQMKEKKDSEFSAKLTDSLARAFNTETENGVSLMDEVAAKVATQYKEAETIAIKDVVSLREALGENKQKIDVDLSGKVDIKQELKNIADEEEY